MPPTSCQIIAIRLIVDHPFVISTSRHVTQGMIDLSDESWNAPTYTLSGTSQVVAGDPYEIRMVTPPQFQGWPASQPSVEPLSTATITTSNDHSPRAIISDNTTGPVSWQVIFSPPQK